MRRQSWIAAIAAGIATLVLASGVEGQVKPAPTPTQRKPASASAPAAPAFPPGLLKPATLKAKAPEMYEVKFITTKGEFTVKVTRAWAPQGADRFYNLVRNRFYDGAHFFRVLPGFVVQFGISAHPQVSKVWREARIPDDPVTQSNKRGFLTFAKANQPNTRTTQVFINLGDNSRLDSTGFAPFGEVTSGMEVVAQLFSGYGEGAPNGAGPDQGKIQAEGKAYLDKDFPNLDSIRTARIVAPAATRQPPRPPAKKP